MAGGTRGSRTLNLLRAKQVLFLLELSSQLVLLDAPKEKVVTDGIRTHTYLGHSQALYRLSYGHSWDGRTRTCGLPRIRRMLCPVELRPIFYGAPGEIRTRVHWLVARHSNPLNYGC